MATSVTAESLEEMVRACVSDIAHLEVVDLTDSGCGDKFRVLVVSDTFDGLKLLERHRLVHDGIAEAMKVIHALELKTYTVAQYEKKKGAAA